MKIMKPQLPRTMQNFHKVSIVLRLPVIIGHIIADDFSEVRETVSADAAGRPVMDYKLTL